MVILITTPSILTLFTLLYFVKLINNINSNITLEAVGVSVFLFYLTLPMI